LKSRIEFEVGQTYENRKGIYEVIAIDGDSMTIRWASGEEVITTVRLQQRIIEAMQGKYPQVSIDSDWAKRKDVRRYTGELTKNNAEEE